MSKESKAAFEPFMATAKWSFLPDVDRTKPGAKELPPDRPPIKILSWNLTNTPSSVVQEKLATMIATNKPDFIALQASELDSIRLEIGEAIIPPYQIASSLENPPSVIIFDSTRWNKKEEEKSAASNLGLGANSLFTVKYSDALNSCPEDCARTQVRVCSVVAPQEHDILHATQLETFLASGHKKSGEKLANIAVGQFSSPVVGFAPPYLLPKNVTAGCLMEATHEVALENHQKGNTYFSIVPVSAAIIDSQPETSPATTPDVDFSKIYIVNSPTSRQEREYWYIKEQQTRCESILGEAKLAIGICTSQTPSQIGYLLQNLDNRHLSALETMQKTRPGFAINRQNRAAWIPNTVARSFTAETDLYIEQNQRSLGFLPYSLAEFACALAEQSKTISEPLFKPAPQSAGEVPLHTDTATTSQPPLQLSPSSPGKKAWLYGGLFSISAPIGAWSLSAGLTKNNNLSLDFLSKSAQIAIGAAISAIALIFFAAMLYYCCKASSRGHKAIEKEKQQLPLSPKPDS